MFDSIEKQKKYQCPSEFGLYKCDDSDDCYSVRKKQTGFGFGYLIALLTCVIVLSSICIVVYSYMNNSNNIPKPIEIITKNTSIDEITNNKTFIPLINVSFIHEFTSEQSKNATEIKNSELDEQINSEESDPVALKYQTDIRRQFNHDLNRPRPFMYEFRDPKPTGFQPTNFQSHNPQNELNTDRKEMETAENRNPKTFKSTVRNIQDIIKLLTEQQDNDQDTDNSNKRIKINKKEKRVRNNYQLKRKNKLPYPTDPFFPYKPQNPSDVNLLALNSFRFAPSIQLDQKKPVITEQYPAYERPNLNNQNQPISVTLDLSQNKRNKKRKPINYPNGFTNNLYNQNQHFNQANRFQYNRQPVQPHFRPLNHNFVPVNKNNKLLQQQQQLQQSLIKGANNPMIVLNLYPKKKRRPHDDSDTDESVVYHNCTNDHNYYDELDNFPQIKNATEFNQLLEQVRHTNLEHIYNDKVTTTDNKNNDENIFRIKDTFLQFDKPPESENQYIQNNDNYLSDKPSEIEVQKSIGFTILNPNFSAPHLSNDDYYSDTESHWHPITVDGKQVIYEDDDNNMSKRDDKAMETDDDKDEHYGLEVGEVNENFDETVTLPLPKDIYERYFNLKPASIKHNNDWDPDIIQQNPNLINHRASFSDDRDE